MPDVLLWLLIGMTVEEVEAGLLAADVLAVLAEVVMVGEETAGAGVSTGETGCDVSICW